MSRLPLLMMILLSTVTPLPADLLPKADQSATFVVPGQEGMRRDLIPKNINIVHISYDLQVMAPGTTFGFSLVGSGFDEAFYKIISIDADALDVSVTNLRLVTANQIHGQIVVGTEATTQYIKPLVIIRSLAVFRAPEPFGVVRVGEVLEMEVTSVGETGQWGKFRVITNLDPTLYKRFKLSSTNAGLEISGVKPNFPFYVEGTVMIGEGLRQGQYGMVAHLGKREVFRKDPLFDVVRPTVGRTGSIDRIAAVEKARRPGDTVEFEITGSAFQPTALAHLSLTVSPLEMGQATFTYVTAGRVQASVRIPVEAPVGIYGVDILYKGKILIQEQNAFGIVPANWLGSIKSVGALVPGQTTQLLIQGRDFTNDFVGKIQLTTDTEGLKVSNLRLQSPTDLWADIKVAPDLAPGDYLVHVQVAGKDVNLPRGNIIHVVPKTAP